MVVGIGVISWDRMIGGILQASYPPDLEISIEMINKIELAHTFNGTSDESEEVIELGFGSNIILSYCDKAKIKDGGYEVLFIIVNKREKFKLESIKSRLSKFGREIFSKLDGERIEYFKKYAVDYFDFKTKKKIIILGRSETGKTSLKKVIFEGADPNEILSNPLEPTLGITSTVYSWVDLQIGVFDSAGQEMSSILSDKDEQAKIFEGANVIIYLLDYIRWVEKSEEILEEIRIIKDILKQNSTTREIPLVVFFHKIDLIDDAIREDNLRKIPEIFKMKLDLPVYFTSIHPEFIHTSYITFNEILGRLSIEARKISSILSDAIGNLQKTTFFVVNEKNSIVAQASTPDFDYSIINHIHNQTQQIIEAFRSMREDDPLKHFMISSGSGLKIMLISFRKMKFDLKYLISVSEKISPLKLQMIMDKIMNKLLKLYAM
ncbi:MAG: ADP-ribosylation factor-like protein [Promethearchaeota archaeon]